MKWQDEVSSLVEAGHAATFAEGRELRNEILERGEEVAAYIQAATHGDTIPSEVGAMSEITTLMRHQRISMPHAILLRKLIHESGHSVKDYLVDEFSDPSTLQIFELAGELVKVAGSVDRAKQAIEAYASI